MGRAPRDVLRASLAASQAGSRGLGWFLCGLTAVMIGFVAVNAERVEAIAFVVVAFGLVTGLPGALLLRSGYRRLERHPLMRALVDHPAPVADVRLSFTPLQGGRHRANVSVYLARGGVHVVMLEDAAPGEEESLVSWLRGQAQVN